MCAIMMLQPCDYLPGSTWTPYGPHKISAISICPHTSQELSTQPSLEGAVSAFCKCICHGNHRHESLTRISPPLRLTREVPIINPCGGGPCRNSIYPAKLLTPSSSNNLSEAHIAIRHYHSSRKPPPNPILSLPWTLIRQVEPGRPPATTAHALQCSTSLQRAPDTPHLPVPRFVFVVVRAGRVPPLPSNSKQHIQSGDPRLQCDWCNQLPSRILKQCHIVKALLDPNIRTSLHDPVGQCGYAKKLRSIRINLAKLLCLFLLLAHACHLLATQVMMPILVTAVSELPDGSGPYYRMLDLPAFSGSGSDGHLLEYKALVWSSAGT